MALYIPHCIFLLARLLYVKPETFGPYYVVHSPLSHTSLTFEYFLFVSIPFFFNKINLSYVYAQSKFPRFNYPNSILTSSVGTP